MKNKIIAWLFPLLLACMISSCSKKEETPSPSDIDEGYQLRPSGQEYDQTILAYYQKYGTLIYYTFTEKEAFWTPTGYRKAVLNPTGIWSTGFEVTTAKTEFIPKQLDLMKKLIFEYYSDEYLKRFLPKRILLCERIDSVYTGYDFSTSPVTYKKAVKTVPAWGAFDQISIGLGTGAIATMNRQDSLRFMNYVSSRMLKNMTENRMTRAVRPDFVELSNYNQRNSSQQDAYNRGIISNYINSPSADSDWALFMEAMLTRSEAKLKATVGSGDTSLNGILSSGKDKNGLIRKRYDIVRAYYKTMYNMDLQRIGNMVNP